MFVLASTGCSLLLNLLTLRLMLFLSTFAATRSPIALPYEGGGEYFGGASLTVFTLLFSLIGTTIGCDGLPRFVWHNLLIGVCGNDESLPSIGGRKRRSILCNKMMAQYYSHVNVSIKVSMFTSRMSLGPRLR
jgi:hypothetical protein